ncbi:hypothetical protein [Paraburkholderia sp.]|uniref:hypothetical protein n=1 Tax=Paraburkholderia sp. TaxID=1926495 RepID=UPI003D6DAEC2
MLKSSLKSFGRPIWNRLRTRIGSEVDQRVNGAVARLAPAEKRIAALEAQLRALALRTQVLENAEALLTKQGVANLIQEHIFIPNAPVTGNDAPFMQYSTCSAADMMHPRYAEICRMIALPPMYQRKFWEWAYIIHHLHSAGALAEGKRGLGFGVGQERLPALFAKLGCEIVATDAPPEIGVSSGWSTTGQHSAALSELKFPAVVDDAVFDAKVSHRFCDMNLIDSSLTGFDFTWSSCCFEHLGSLEAGLQFVINSVEKTLKPGGIAVHTTEYNLSSNDETVTDGPTVIYRRRDMEDLVSRLLARGHEVQPFIIAPHAHALDFHVDAPPYTNNPHLKLRLLGHTTTSVGIFVRRTA